ncbi:MAG TPA: ABC transporter permease [Thermomicrobiaceae bacterium]|nr:ABC transporter permease [Thermomicrobiaceae bacterium]
MGAYIARRLLLVIPTILAVYTITFVLMHATPGGPWDNADRPLSPQAIANLNAKYHLNDPLWKQYVDYLGNVVHGDLGPSYVNTSRSVTDIIRDFFPVSLKLGIVAMILGTVIGLTLGVIAALNQNSWVDYTAMFGAVVGIATPSYVMATVLIYLLALELHLVPTTGWGGVFNIRIIIPALALSLGPAAQLARYTRTSVLETLRQHYILTAQAKGLRYRAVVVRHVMKNAMNPVVTIAGLLLANVITGSFFVETICGVPGIGRYFVTAATGRDYPVLMALTLLFAILIIFANLLVDIAYGFLDPRVSYS